MANDTVQRENWSGEPARLGEAWRLRKPACPAKEAICRLESHQFGWELRLEVKDSLLSSQVCRNAEQILTTQEQWKAAMREKGWR